MDIVNNKSMLLEKFLDQRVENEKKSIKILSESLKTVETKSNRLKKYDFIVSIVSFSNFLQFIADIFVISWITYLIESHSNCSFVPTEYLPSE